MAGAAYGTASTAGCWRFGPSCWTRPRRGTRTLFRHRRLRRRTQKKTRKRRRPTRRRRRRREKLRPRGAAPAKVRGPAPQAPAGTAPAAAPPRRPQVGGATRAARTARPARPAPRAQRRRAFAFGPGSGPGPGPGRKVPRGAGRIQCIDRRKLNQEHLSVPRSARCTHGAPRAASSEVQRTRPPAGAAALGAPLGPAPAAVEASQGSENVGCTRQHTAAGPAARARGIATVRAGDGPRPQGPGTSRSWPPQIKPQAHR